MLQYCKFDGDQYFPKGADFIEPHFESRGEVCGTTFWKHQWELQHTFYDYGLDRTGLYAIFYSETREEYVCQGTNKAEVRKKDYNPMLLYKYEYYHR